MGRVRTINEKGARKNNSAVETWAFKNHATSSRILGLFNILATPGRLVGPASKRFIEPYKYLVLLSRFSARRPSVFLPATYVASIPGQAKRKQRSGRADMATARDVQEIVSRLSSSKTKTREVKQGRIICAPD